MIYGNVREATLISSFLQFVQENERILIEKFLNQESTLFSGDENEVIWEVLIDVGVSAIQHIKVCFQRKTLVFATSYERRSW